MKLFAIIVILFTAYWYVSCQVKVADNQRAIVLRLAKYEVTLSAGTHYTVPFIDRVIVVNLDKLLPEWALLSLSEINSKIKKQFLTDPDKFMVSVDSN